MSQINKNDYDFILEVFGVSLNNVNVSYEKWSEDTNTISKKDILILARTDISEVKNKIKSLEEEIKQAKKSRSLIERLFCKTPPKQLKLENQLKQKNNEIKEIEKNQNAKIKDLEKANKKILEFKYFKKTFKAAKLAVYLANSSTKNRINSSFFEKYQNKAKKNKENLDIDYKLEAEKLVCELFEKFKKAKLPIKQYFALPQMKQKGNPRISDSGKTDEIDNTDMFENVSDEKKIKKIFIPYAHDAGTGSMVPESKFDLTKIMAQTQRGNFTALLKAGARAFDVRVKLIGKVPRFFHGPVTGGSFIEEALKIANFLKNHTSEIVILTIRMPLSCIQYIQSLSIMKPFLDMIYFPVERKTSEITIGAMRKSGKRILIISDDNLFVENFCMPMKDAYIYHPNTSERSSWNNETRYNHEKKFLGKNTNSNLMTQGGEYRTPGVLSVLCAPLRKLFGQRKMYSPISEAKHSKKATERYLKLAKNKGNMAGLNDVRSMADVLKGIKEE